MRVRKEKGREWRLGYEGVERVSEEGGFEGGREGYDYEVRGKVRESEDEGVMSVWE